MDLACRHMKRSTKFSDNDLRKDMVTRSSTTQVTIDAGDVRAILKDQGIGYWKQESCFFFLFGSKSMMFLGVSCCWDQQHPTHFISWI